MRTIIITKFFSDGTIKISSKPLIPGTCITELISYLNYQMKRNILLSYEIEIVKGEEK